MVQPLTALAVSFSLGIAAARFLSLPAWAVFCLSAFSVAASRCVMDRGRVFIPLILLSAFCLGSLGHHAAKPKPLPKALERGPVLVSGRVVSDPVLLKRSVRFVLEVFEAANDGERVRAVGPVDVVSYARCAFRYGDDVLCEGSFQNDKNQGAFVIKKKGVALVLGSGQGNVFAARIFDIRHKAREAIGRHLAYPFSDILAAMLLGEAASVPAVLKTAMLETGTWHLMVVSGSHTALLAFVLLMVFKIARCPRRLRVFLTMAALAAYSVLTGGSSPVVRAAVMTSSLLLTFLLERPPDFSNSLSLAALIILVFDPDQLFSAGFQLSFLSVFFIFWLFPKLRAMFPEYVWKTRVLSWPVGTFCACLAAWVGTSPLLAYAFGSFSCVAVMANMAAVPLATFIVACGLVFLCLAFLAPGLASLAAGGCEAGIALLSQACLSMGRFSFSSITVPPMPFALIVLSYGLIFWAAGALTLNKKQGNRQTFP